MRTNHLEARDRAARDERSLLSIFAEALGLVRQDFSEYGFAALIGATAAAIVALALKAIGGPVATAAVLPAVLFFALWTLATGTAAVRRVLENLEPDSVRSFESALVRAPFIVLPFLLPLATALLAGAALLLADEWTGSFLAGVIALALLALAGYQALPRSLYLPALFARGSSARGSLAVSENVVRSAPVAVLLGWTFMLMPASLIATAAAGAGFGVVSTAFASFAFVFSMPACASLMTLLYEYAGLTEDQLGAQRQPAQRPAQGGIVQRGVRQQPPSPRGDSVAERLNRHIR